MVDFVSEVKGDTVTYAQVEELAEKYGVSTRSVSAKLRYAGKKVEPKPKTKKYTDEEESLIREMAESGSYIEDIAEKLGKTNKQIRGKLLSMKIYGIPQRDKQQPKGKTYTAEEENRIRALVQQQLYLEDIAQKLNRTPKQIRGKLLSMKLYGVKQRDKKEPKPKVYTDDVIEKITQLHNAGKTEAEIAKELNLNPNGLHRKMVSIGLIQAKSKPKFWTEDKLETLKANINKSDAELAEMLGTTPLVIAKKRKEIA